MSATQRVDRRTIGLGTVLGVVTYALGYLVTYLTQRGTVEERLRGFNFVAELFGGDPIPAWKAVGWLFFNAHFVETELPGFGGTRTENFVASVGDGSLTWLYLVPPLILLAAGVVLAVLSRAGTPADGVVLGALVVVGYLPLAVAGAFVFGFGGTDWTIAPDVVTAVLLAGIVYPTVFGAVGGAIGGLVGD